MKTVAAQLLWRCTCTRTRGFEAAKYKYKPKQWQERGHIQLPNAPEHTRRENSQAPADAAVRTAIGVRHIDGKGQAP